MSDPLLDVERLTAWLDGEGLEPGQPLHVERLVGGRSNVMFAIDRGSHRWVLRRPAQVALERANDGMRREYRMLAALGGTPVPHPAVVAMCDDHDVLGCTFYVMQRVEGFNPITPLPPALDSDEQRAAVSYALVDALALLHDVDWRTAGLADLGHPEQFHERQVGRWTKQLASYEGREMPGIAEVTAWLDGNRPASFTPTLMHADYHMLNVLIAPEPPARVVAIVDWETATIGDPLLDLAGFCEAWCTGDRDSPQWPSRRQLIGRYTAQRNLPADLDLTYYEVLYNFRLAVLLEGIYQRSLRDPSRPDQVEMGERALFNARRALQLIVCRT